MTTGRINQVTALTVETDALPKVGDRRTVGRPADGPSETERLLARRRASQRTTEACLDKGLQASSPLFSCRSPQQAV